MKDGIGKGILGIFFFVALTFSVFASEGGPGEEYHVATFGKAEVYQIINFILLVILLGFLYKKYAGGGFEKRSQQIKMAMEEAEQAKREAEKKYKDYTSRIKRLDRDIQELFERAREEGKKEQEQILEEARVQAEKIRKQGETTAKQEILYAKQVLREETINLAAELARGLLEKSATQDDHRKFVELYIKKLGELN